MKTSRPLTYNNMAQSTLNIDGERDSDQQIVMDAPR